MFRLEQPNLIKVDPLGVDDSHPLFLENIEVYDFERLLWIIYPR
jgi:hypothetical protein